MNMKTCQVVIVAIVLNVILGVMLNQDGQSIIKMKKKTVKIQNTWKVKKVCNHNSAYIRVVSIQATCETTVLVCEDCKKVLSKPTTEAC